MSDAVRVEDARLPSFDGTEIACRVWEPARLPEGRPVALIHHGVGGHGGAYSGLGAFFAGLGVPLCAPDARGHGRSGGERGEMHNGRTMLADLHAMVCWVRRRYPGRRLLLVGESMGGLFALNYAALYAPDGGDVSALILVAPGLLIHPRQVADFTVVRRTPQARRAASEQGQAMRTWRAALVGSRDPDWLRTYAADPLVLPEVNGRYMRIVAAMSMRSPAAARRWTGPTLLLHGKSDTVVPYQGSVMLYRLLAAPDKELALFPDVQHTMFSDPDTPRVLTTIEGWVSAHFGES